MKFKLVEQLQEEFDNIDQLRSHFNDHMFNKKNMPFEYTPDREGMMRYQRDADNLALQMRYAHKALSYKEDPSIDLVGFIRDDGKYNLYRRSTNEFVVFNPEPNNKRITTGNVIISYYSPTAHDTYWEAVVVHGDERGRKMMSELPHNQDGGEGPQKTQDELNKEQEIKKQQSLLAQQKEQQKKEQELANQRNATRDKAKSSYEKKAKQFKKK